MARDTGPATFRNWITKRLPKLWDTKEHRIRQELHRVESELQWLVRVEVEDAGR